MAQRIMYLSYKTDSDWMLENKKMLILRAVEQFNQLSRETEDSLLLNVLKHKLVIYQLRIFNLDSWTKKRSWGQWPKHSLMVLWYDFAVTLLCFDDDRNNIVWRDILLKVSVPSRKNS